MASANALAKREAEHREKVVGTLDGLAASLQLVLDNQALIMAALEIDPEAARAEREAAEAAEAEKAAKEAKKAEKAAKSEVK